MPRRILALPVLASIALALALVAGASARTNSGSIALVAYSTPRAAYADLIPAFQKTPAGKDTSFQQSYGASGEQARAVEAGLKADVVALSLEPDVTTLVNKGIVPRNWKNDKWGGIVTRSVVVFAVRKGNPKKIRDWEDLVKPGVQIVTPNPKTSGGARWNYLAAWGYAQKKFGSPDKAKQFVGDLFKNVPVLDTGARGSTVTFVERGVGDVLLAWENEAFLAQREFGKDKFEIVAPPLSILAEPPVAIVDKVVAKKGTAAVAEAYLKYWYTKEGQEIAARNSYRPRDSEIAREYEKSFAKVELFTIDDVFGGWTKAQKEHFAEGGIFDQIYKN